MNPSGSSGSRFLISYTRQSWACQVRLLPLEIRRPLLQKRAHPFLGVFAGAEEAEEGGFEELALFEGHLQAVVDGFDGGSYRNRGAGDDFLCHLLARRHELVGRDDAVDE